jgi:GNAT superfamily N-acetyltransferase
MAPAYTIVDGDPSAHKDAVLALAARNLPGLTRHRFEKRYERHPLGEPRLVLAQDQESGAFVGLAAAFPTRLLVGGRAVQAAMPGDFAVDAAHRGFGPGLALQRRLHARLAEWDVEVAYGAPNRFAEAILIRLRYTDVGRFTDFVKILKADVVVERYVRRPRAARAARAVSAAVLDPALRLDPRERRLRRPHPFSVEHAPRFDDRFARLLASAGRRHAVTGLRECELLNWKYETTDPPAAGPRHRVFALFDARGDAVGFIAYRTEDRVRRVYDILVDEAERTVDALLSEYLLDSRAAGASAVSLQYLGPEAMITSRLRAHGFLPRTGKTGVRVKPMSGRPLVPSVEDARNWYYLLGENDI